MSPSNARGEVPIDQGDEDVIVLDGETLTASGSSSSGIQGGQVWPKVQFRQMTEMNLDATAMEELARM
eukprot:8876747-Prorocentrum_lima.AAC.1